MKNDNLLHYKGYSAKPEYSVEDKVFYGKILGIDDLVDFYSENAKMWMSMNFWATRQRISEPQTLRKKWATRSRISEPPYAG